MYTALPIERAPQQQAFLADIYALVFGIAYTVAGVLGFFVAPNMDIHDLLIFPVNLLHNAVHFLVGLAGIAALLTWRSVTYARAMAILFLILAACAFFPQPFLGVVPLVGPDVILHALTAILGAAAGLIPPPALPEERPLRRAA